MSSSLFSKETPFLAKISERQLLSGNNSSKKTYHISLNIKGSGLSFEEGDAVGIIPSNDPSLVKRILTITQLPKECQVIHPRTKLVMTFEDFLTKAANLSRVTPSLFSLLKNQTSSLSTLNDEEIKDLCVSHDVVTFLDHFFLQTVDIQDFCDAFSPLLPRFYSIASSQLVSADSIDLLVASFTYSVQNEKRAGLGSEFLCSFAKLDESVVPLYIHHNPHFKLPLDSSVPIVMLGAGTGIAPYRAFLQNRAFDHTSKNWLFFGERQKSCDFYYEKELLDYAKRGLLELTTAFSRDQEEKIYIQHQLYSHRVKVWEWIEQGAVIYLCGDAKQMAKDVTATLLKIFESEGGLSEIKAKEFFLQLRKEKRFQQDVY